MAISVLRDMIGGELKKEFPHENFAKSSDPYPARRDFEPELRSGDCAPRRCAVRIPNFGIRIEIKTVAASARVRCG